MSAHSPTNNLFNTSSVHLPPRDSRHSLDAPDSLGLPSPAAGSVLPPPDGALGPTNSFTLPHIKVPAASPLLPPSVLPSATVPGGGYPGLTPTARGGTSSSAYSHVPVHMYGMPLTGAAGSRPGTRGGMPGSPSGVKPGASLFADTVAGRSFYSDAASAASPAVSAEPSIHFSSTFGVLNPTATAAATPAGDATRLKAEQLRMLQDQNAHLLSNYESLETRANVLITRNEELENLVRTLKLQLVELTTHQRNDLAEKQRLYTDVEERSSQASMLAEQNREFMRRMEMAEERCKQAEARASATASELEAARSTVSALQATLRASEDRHSLQGKDLAAKMGDLNAIRAEFEALRIASAEAARKAAVEIESLQEALRVRKEKQYSLLEKAAAADELARKSKDEAGTLSEALRGAQLQAQDLRARLAAEDRSKSSHAEALNAALKEAEHARAVVAELRARLDTADSDKLKLEAELRIAGDNVREMAQKVFAVLERLKLSEMGKTKAIDALKQRDTEIAGLKKKLERVQREGVKDGKHAAALEAEVHKLTQELEAIKATNAALSNRCKDETKAKLTEQSARVSAEEKLHALQVRVATLLKKLQTEETSSESARADLSATAQRVETLLAEVAALQRDLASERDNTRVLTSSLREKREECDKLALQVKRAAISASSGGGGGGSDGADDGFGGEESKWADGDGGIDDDLEASGLDVRGSMVQTAASIYSGAGGGGGGGGAQGATLSRDRERVAENVEPDNDTVRANGGKGRFYVDARPSQGYIFIKGERRSAKALLRRLNINEALKKFQRMRPAACMEALIGKLCHLLGLALVEGEDRLAVAKRLSDTEEHLSVVGRTNDGLLARLEAEQVSRRQVVVGYARAVTAHAVSQSALATSIAALTRLNVPGGEGGGTSVPAPLPPRPGSVAVKLNDCCLGDEEVYALVAVLRDETEGDAGAGSRPATAAAGSTRASSAPSPSSAASAYRFGLAGSSVIQEVYLCRNHITDEATRSLVTLLSDPGSSIRHVDLRGNHVTIEGVKRLAEALERNTNVAEVVVRGSWKIEAMLTPIGLAAASAVAGAHHGDAGTAAAYAAAAAAAHAKMACIVVDVRDQTPEPKVNALLHTSDLVPASVDRLHATADLLRASVGPTPSTASAGPTPAPPSAFNSRGGTTPSGRARLRSAPRPGGGGGGGGRSLDGGGSRLDAGSSFVIRGSGGSGGSPGTANASRDRVLTSSPTLGGDPGLSLPPMHSATESPLLETPPLSPPSAAPPALVSFVHPTGGLMTGPSIKLPSLRSPLVAAAEYQVFESISAPLAATVRRATDGGSGSPVPRAPSRGGGGGAGGGGSNSGSLRRGRAMSGRPGGGGSGGSGLGDGPATGQSRASPTPRAIGSGGSSAARTSQGGARPGTAGWAGGGRGGTSSSSVPPVSPMGTGPSFTPFQDLYIPTEAVLPRANRFSLD